MTQFETLDIRWKQRFENLTKVKKLLDGIIPENIEKMKYVEVAGWIHIYDLVFELSWKTLHDYMIAQGESRRMNFPREIIQIGFANGYIDDVDTWIEMLADRNNSTHEYDEKIALNIVTHIQSKYIKALTHLYDKIALCL